MSEDIIVAESLTKIFNGGLVAVNRVNFRVKHGEAFAAVVAAISIILSWRLLNE